MSVTLLRSFISLSLPSLNSKKPSHAKPALVKSYKVGPW